MYVTQVYVSVSVMKNSPYTVVELLNREQLTRNAASLDWFRAGGIGR